ncbi:MAG: hypothetical protein GY798_04285 [Hyphomicrobiales bacterium]|nr:hypothetical protein [Hyphomicrobiales bacterium]
MVERKPGAIVVAVRLTPRASREGIDGIADDAAGRSMILARVRAPPADGAANKALVGLLARTFGVRKSSITLVSGLTSRLKRVRIAGDTERLVEVLEKWSPAP